MNIQFYIWLPSFDLLFDVFTAWVCVGSIVLFPWSIWRASVRGRLYKRLMTSNVFAATALVCGVVIWPVAATAVIKRGLK